MPDNKNDLERFLDTLPEDKREAARAALEDSADVVDESPNTECPYTFQSGDIEVRTKHDIPEGQAALKEYLDSLRSGDVVVDPAKIQALREAATEERVTQVPAWTESKHENGVWVGISHNGSQITTHGRKAFNREYKKVREINFRMKTLLEAYGDDVDKALDALEASIKEPTDVDRRIYAELVAYKAKKGGDNRGGLIVFPSFGSTTPPPMVKIDNAVRDDRGEGPLFGKLPGMLLAGYSSGDSFSIDFLSDTMKVSLHTSTMSPNQDTWVTWADITNEVSGTGYTTRGATLANKSLSYNSSTNVTTMDADDTSWATSTITARYAVLYKDTGTNGTSVLVGYFDFGSDQISTNGTFTIVWNASGIATFTVA